jgi:hypothetical protein
MAFDPLISLSGQSFVNAIPTVNPVIDFQSALLTQQRIAQGQRQQQIDNLFATGNFPRLPDGSPDYIAIQNMMAPKDPIAAIRLGPDVQQQIYGQQLRDVTAPGGGAQPTGPYFDRFVGSIAQSETGGERNPYGSVTSTGTGHRVYGKYQVYDENIGPWTQQYYGQRLTPAQFLANPAAQEAVARGKLGDYVQQYGYEGASRAWLAGPGGAYNPQARDRFGSTPQSYAAKVLGRIGAPDDQGALPTRVAAAPPAWPTENRPVGAVRAWPTENLAPGETAYYGGPPLDQTQAQPERLRTDATAPPRTAVAPAQPERLGDVRAQLSDITQGFGRPPPSAGGVTPPVTQAPPAGGQPIYPNVVPTTRERPPQPLVPREPGDPPPGQEYAYAQHYERLAGQPGLPRNTAQFYLDKAAHFRALVTPMQLPPGGLYDPRTGERLAASGAALTGPALQAAAEVYRQTGRFPANLGRGVQGREDQNNIIALADALERQAGGDPVQWPQKWQEYHTHQTGLTRFTSGKQGDTVRSFNVLVDHFGVLDEATRALKNRDNAGFNYLRQVVARATGGTAPTDFSGVKAIVGDELAKAVIGSAGALGDREEIKRELSEVRSEGQLLSLIEKYRRLALGQLRGLRKEYETATGRRDFDDMLLPGTREYFEQGAGSRIESGPAPARGGADPLGIR